MRENKLLTNRCGSNVVQPSFPGQFSSETPWGFSPKKLPAFCFRQFGYFFQIHLDADFKRFLRFLKGVGFNSYVKVGTVRLPIAIIGVGIAPQSISHLPHTRLYWGVIGKN